MPTPKKTQADRLALAIQKRVIKSVSKGLKDAGRLLESEVKKTLSTPAPRKRVKPRDGSPPYWRATTPATPGAPPRRLSGALRKSVKVEVLGPLRLVLSVKAKSRQTAKRPGGFRYGRYHEVPGLGKGSGRHQFIKPTWARVKPDFLTILRRNVKADLRY